MRDFHVVSEFEPSGDQGQAIDGLVKSIKSGEKFQTLVGVTGSGKTFTMAKVIEQVNKPTLIMSHNKTLAAQLYREFKNFFPDNAVEYFVSYYDYFQPEAYIAATDKYIEKDSSINQDIDMMRLSATSSLMDRRDVIIVSTVSCIYGLGNPDDYKDLSIHLNKTVPMSREDLIKALVGIQYDRSDDIFQRGTFRVRGDIIDIYPAYSKTGFRIEFFGDEIDRICKIDITNNYVLDDLDQLTIFPARHFVSTPQRIHQAIPEIRADLAEQVKYFNEHDQPLYAYRIKQRTEYDIDMLLECGFCSGIENYSRYIAGRKPGERPATLFDFFPDDFLLFIDESHGTVPQIGGMYNGDRARKTVLVKYGFRLPSALDNRPLVFEEFEKIVNQVVFVSATPKKYELDHSKTVVEQLIRPTGLREPPSDVRPTEGQMDDLISEINEVVEQGERVLVTTLTKQMAEDLTDYMLAAGVKVNYMHSDIKTIERTEILQDLRKGKIDVLVGINLLREGLDLPEVSLVAILDADKIGFLRDTISLIQTIGRAARNAHGRVIMYADRMSDDMKEAISETKRRRAIQQAYNEEHGIVPKTIIKKIDTILDKPSGFASDGYAPAADTPDGGDIISEICAKHSMMSKGGRDACIKELTEAMHNCAKNLDFENAALIRDAIEDMKGKS